MRPITIAQGIHPRGCCANNCLALLFLKQRMIFVQRTWKQARVARINFHRVQTQETHMRILMIAVSAALVLSIPLATSAKTDETTVIKKERDYDGDSTTVIKRTDEPVVEKKTTIIKKERED